MPSSRRFQRWCRALIYPFRHWLRFFILSEILSEKQPHGRDATPTFFLTAPLRKTSVRVFTRLEFGMLLVGLLSKPCYGCCRSFAGHAAGCHVGYILNCWLWSCSMPLIPSTIRLCSIIDAILSSVLSA